MKPFFLILLLLATPLSFASDHIDGPATTKHRITDLTDFYAFKTPGKEGSLTLVANAHPLAWKNNHFSSKVQYRFIIREAQIAGKQVVSDPKSETSIVITFDDSDHDKMTLTAEVNPNMRRTVRFNQIDRKEHLSGLRVFGGLRSDPFFFNKAFAEETSVKGKKAKPKNSDIMARANILSVVVDVDLSLLFKKDVSLLTLAVESTSLNKEGERVRLDRIGRPEVTNVTMVGHEGDKEYRDQYNREAPFHVLAKNEVEYRKHILKNIKFYDKIDGKTHWTEEKAQAYVDLILSDFLVIDVSQEANTEMGYFAIESALLEGADVEAIGGRELNDDIMDRLFTILINSDEGNPVKDGVDAPFTKVSDTFPYLAKPDLGIRARLKKHFGSKALYGN